MVAVGSTSCGVSFFIAKNGQRGVVSSYLYSVRRRVSSVCACGLEEGDHHPGRAITSPRSLHYGRTQWALLADLRIRREGALMAGRREAEEGRRQEQALVTSP